MAGVTGKSQIDQATETYLAESRFTLQERPGVIAGSVRTENLPKNAGAAVNIPKYGTVSTFSLTEGVDMGQAQQITDTLMTLTPTEYGAQVVLTDLMLMTVKDEFFRVAGRILADSFDRQREETLADDFDNFSSTNGAQDEALSVGAVMANHARIKGNAAVDGASERGGEPGPDPVTGVVTPAVMHDLRRSMTGGIGPAPITAQVVPDLDRAPWSEQVPVAGVMIKSSVNLKKAADDGVKCGFFSREATILVSLDGGPSLEKERDASLRGWELNFVGRWARGEYNDGWGVEGLYDSARPTT